jgi:hypothetical protein
MGSVWKDYYQYSHTYDANNFMMSSVNKMWNDTGLIEEGDSAYYYFHTILGVEDIESQDESITVYPNPGSGKFAISSDTPVSSLEIYNMFGETIYTDYSLNPQTSFTIDLSGQSKGVYFAKIQAGTKVISRKIMIQ